MPCTHTLSLVCSQWNKDYDMSDDDGVFQDAPEEWSKKPEKPRPRYQRHTSNVEILEDMTPSPLDAKTFLIPGALPECSVDTFQEPLRIIEEEGIEKYLDWLASSTTTKHSTVQTHQERQLADATIAGDPREYQRLLLESALAQNTIVHLGTGYGKTLIALLLIKEKSIEWKNDKQAVFLVPSVALAIQQALSLRANLPFTVETACYDASNSEIHRHKLQKAQIIVATHGAVRHVCISRNLSHVVHSHPLRSAFGFAHALW